MTWTTFAALTNATTLQLDGNFAVLSGLDPIPCTVAGTNTLTLTSIAGAATVMAYTNYMQLTGIAANSNSGAVVAQLGSLSALNVYKDTPTGPVVLVGNEIVAGNEFTLVYDSALNIGSGGFHLKTGGSELVGQTVTMAKLIGTTGSISGLMSVGSLQVGVSAPTLTRLMSATTTAAFTNLVASGGGSSVTITLPGASVGDVCGVGFMVPPPNASITFIGYIGAAGSAHIKAINCSAASIAAFTTTLRVQAMGYT